MANVEEVSTWRDCLEAISRIQKDYNDDLNGVWFRGHASANWNLTTTLERRVQQRVSFTDYYNKTIRRIKPAIDSYTDAAWEMPPPKKKESWAKDYEKGSRKQIHCYDYLAHLGHNGFPS